MKLTDFLENIGRPIAYYPSLRIITGSTPATILLCQFIYWRGKESDPNGWLYKSLDDIEDETGLSHNEQKTAREKLKKAGLLQEHYARIDHQLWFRVDLDRLNQEWGKLKSDFPESGNPAFGKATFPFSLNSNTETTQEITTPKGKAKVQTSKGTDDIAYELFKALSDAGIKISRDKFKKIVREKLNEMDEGGTPVNNKQWNVAYDFPADLEPIIQNLEKGLGIRNMMRDERAIETYRWIAQQEGLDKFIEWATSSERVQYVQKYRRSPEQIKNEWKIAVNTNQVSITKLENGEMYV